MFERKYKISMEEPNKGKLVKKDTSMPIPDDEPLFILRAQDRKALPALLAYSFILDNLEQKMAVAECVNDFRLFQEKNPERMKEPDP